MERFQLMDTYKAYKLRERKFTTWLKETAEKAGYKSDDNDKRVPGPSFVPVAVRIGDMIKLAKAIVASEPEDPCPPSFRQALRDVISQRKEAAAFYKQRSATDENFAKNTEGHLYYIKVLENVAKTFDDASSISSSSKLSSTKSPSFTAPTTTEKETQLSNLFGLLETEFAATSEGEWELLEEDNESDRENLGRKKSTTNKKKKGKGKFKKTSKGTAKAKDAHPIADMGMFDSHIEYEIEEEDPEYMFWFLLYCFFKDFNEIRDYLQEKWCDYEEGLLSLSAVSVVTNTAFDMFQKFERELLSFCPQEIPRTSAYETIAMYLFTEGGLAHVDYDEATRRGEVETDSGAAIYEEASWLCLPIFWCLKDWLKHAPPGKIPTNLNFVGTPIDYRPEMTDEKMKRDNRFLHEFLAECSIFKKLKQDGCRIPAEDELTKGMIQMLITRKINVWLVFACQVYVDIRNILETQHDRAFLEFLMMGDRVKSTIDGQLEFHKPEQTPDEFLDLLYIAREEVTQWADEDVVEPSRSNVHKNNGVPEDDPMLQGHFFLRRHPLLCGLLTFRSILTLNEHGLTASNIYGSTIGVAHLYNAVQRQKPSSATWPDMETLLLIHGKEHIFWRSAFPRNPAEYSHCYDYTTGADGMIAQRNQTNETGVILPSHIRHRGIGPVSVVASLFHERYCFEHDEPIHTLPNVERVLSHVAQNEMHIMLDGLRALEDKSPSIERIREERALSDRVQLAGADDETLSKQYEKTRALTSIQLLEALNRRITEESVPLAFDYFSFYQRCTRVLRNVYEEFEIEIDKLSGEPIYTERGKLPLVPHYIFLLIEKNSNVVERLSLVLHKYATEEGEKEVLAVRHWLKQGNIIANETRTRTEGI